MNHIVETILFIVLFALIGYLFLVVIGLYGIVEEMISESELKMNNIINELKTKEQALEKAVENLK